MIDWKKVFTYLTIFLLLSATLCLGFYFTKEYYEKVGYNQGAQDASMAIAQRILQDLQVYGGTAFRVDNHTFVLKLAELDNSTEKV